MQKILISYRLCILMVGIIASQQSIAQLRSFNRSLISGDGNMQSQMTGAGKSDSLKRRNDLADSITIYYRYFDSTRIRLIDSSVNDFDKRFPVPYKYHTLGNYGTAAQSLLFQPVMQSGFDAGFHTFDLYQFTLKNTKWYETTRPYTELVYLLGSKAEQLIQVTHTQNRKDNFNFSLEYRFSNAPGNLKNQNASHNNFRFTASYRSPNRKYNLQFIFLSNKAAASENGGLQNKARIDSLALNDPFELETRLGLTGSANRNPFNTTVNTGNIHKVNDYFIRQSYSLGPSDSLVTDSIVYKIFYPRFRIEHTFHAQLSDYLFLDRNVDSLNYRKYFNAIVPDNQALSFNDKWSNIINELNIISFPEKDNLSQYLKAGIGYQYLSGKFNASNAINLYNIYVSGEYRNRTRNKKWDIETAGKFFVNGVHSGDYEITGNLKRSLGVQLGNIAIQFQNANKSPAFSINNSLSSFPVNARTLLAKENIIKLGFLYEQPRKSIVAGITYFAISNYIFSDNFFTYKQEPTLFNVIQFHAEKKIQLSRFWNWYTEIHVQTTTGKAPLNLPFILTRNRISFEGNFYKNLFLSTGVELRYHTGYKADGYSPFLGQFYYQNQSTIQNRPDIHLFLHFRIKSFKGFIRFENLNSLNLSKGFTFNKPNFVSELYPSTSLWTRVGIWWNFVN